MALGCQGLSLLGDAACVLCPRQPVAFGLSGPRGLGLVLRGRWAGRRWLEGLTEEPQQRTPQTAEEEPPAPTCGASESVTAVFSADLLPGDHGPLRQEEHAPGGVLPARAQVREPRRARPAEGGASGAGLRAAGWVRGCVRLRASAWPAGEGEQAGKGLQPVTGANGTRRERRVHVT